ncbi:MAG: SPOR domain-containing protein [Deltaproteobacteria bacterium]|jgi:cell division septation protein DedD|nr:SPOR domain-containing protein [Deltaproteobacteria bacterium]
MTTNITSDLGPDPQASGSVLPPELKPRIDTEDLVERLLKNESTFFDHYRLKYLGGQVEEAKISLSQLGNGADDRALLKMRAALQAVKLKPVSSSETLALPEIRNFPGSLTNDPNGSNGANKGSNGSNGANGANGSSNSKGANGSNGSNGANGSGGNMAGQASPAGGQAIDQNQANGSNEKSEEKSLESPQLADSNEKNGLNQKESSAPQAEAKDSAENAQVNAPEAIDKSKKAGASPAKESLFMGAIKWLTKLLKSISFLVWIFFLGIMLGRGLLTTFPELWFGFQTPSEPEIIKNLADNQTDNDDIEPLALDYPMVIEQYEAGDLQLSAAAVSYPSDYSDNFLGATSDTIFVRPTPSANSTVAPNVEASDQAASIDTLKAQPQIASPVPNEPSLKTNGPGVSPANPGQQIAGKGQTNATPTKPAIVSDDSDLFWPAKPTKPGAYTVQVASPKSESAAKAAAENFIKKGFEAYYYRSSDSRYPVRVGRYATEEEAQVVRAQLSALGAYKPYVSRLNP